MPTYSRAISNELNELFSTVEKQALEYAQAFSYISAKITEFDNKMAHLDNFRDDYTNNIAMLTNETRETVTTLSEDLRSQLDLVVKLNTEYVQIVEFKESLIAMYNKMKFIINQNELNQREFKNRIDQETQKFINTCKLRSDKALETSLSTIDEKIAGIAKEIGTKVGLNNEQLTQAIIEARNELALLRDEIDKNRNDIDVLLEQTTEEVDLFESKEEDLAIKTEIKNLKEENASLLDEIKELKAMQSQMQELKNKVNNILPTKEETTQSNGLAIAGLIAAIIAIALAVII